VARAHKRRITRDAVATISDSNADRRIYLYIVEVAVVSVLKRSVTVTIASKGKEIFQSAMRPRGFDATESGNNNMDETRAEAERMARMTQREAGGHQ
jgi:hypothetical protein